jgi:hypothetical protein
MIIKVSNRCLIHAENSQFILRIKRDKKCVGKYVGGNLVEAGSKWETIGYYSTLPNVFLALTREAISEDTSFVDLEGVIPKLMMILKHVEEISTGILTASQAAKLNGSLDFSEINSLFQLDGSDVVIQQLPESSEDE